VTGGRPTRTRAYPNATPLTLAYNDVPTARLMNGQNQMVALDENRPDAP
jgi:hypothetical protein